MLVKSRPTSYRGLLVLLLAGVSLTNSVCSGDVADDNGYCHKSPDGSVDCDEDTTSDVTLVRLHGGDVGDEQELSGLIPGKSLRMKTLSTKPLAFEVPGFLSDEECDYFIELAEKEGLVASQTVQNTGRKMDGQQIRLTDVNKDQRLSLDEMILTLETSFDMYLTSSDLVDMYNALEIDANKDTFITYEELSTITPAILKEYVDKFGEDHPVKRSRFSKQVWLHADSSSDEVFQMLQERVQRLTELPLTLIKKSPFQIVSYGPEGHYNAHLDSNRVNLDQACCTKSRQGDCRICRFMTVLFYLNNVEEGGHTAFPVAGNETYDEFKFRESHKINLQEHCAEANLVVAPARGKAVMWYNHFIDEETGWMGEMDRYSWHGGCPVIKGEKWIANFWITTTDDKEADLKEDYQEPAGTDDQGEDV